MSIQAVIIGCLTGFVSAFFGIGGSSIDTPLIRTFLGLDPLQSLGTPLPLTVLTSTIAFMAYRRSGLVDWRLAGLGIAGAIPGIIAGSLVTAWLSGIFLMLLTAVILFLVGIDFIVKDMTEKTFAGRRHGGPKPGAGRILALTAPIGVISGMLANGGGIFFVPAFVILFRMRIKEAIATSLVIVAAVALPGSIIHISLGHVDSSVMASMALGVVPMAWLGARTDIRTRSNTLMLLYGLLLTAFSVFFFISQLP